MSALSIEKVNDEAKCGDGALEKWDLFSNPTSCPQGLGIRSIGTQLVACLCSKKG